MSTQSEAVRDGVHLEAIALNRWRLTGKRTIYCIREEKRMSRSKQRRLHYNGDAMDVFWSVKEDLTKQGTQFQSISSALTHAYVQAGSIPLEI